jgi:hypothetical protein
VQVPDVVHLPSPELRAEHRGAGLKVGQRLVRPRLGETESSSARRDQHGAHARRPALLGKQVKERQRLIELSGLDGDVGQHRCGECEPRREIALLQHAQGHSRGAIRLRERSEPQLEQAERAVRGDQATGAAGAVDLGKHETQRLGDCVKALRRDEAP